MSTQRKSANTLVLGIGNRLMTDDSIGPLAADHMAERMLEGVLVLDGGTVGMALLPDIEDCDHLVVFDAGNVGLNPGDVKVLEGDAMLSALAGRRLTAHEASLSDMLTAARINGTAPRRYALIAVQAQVIALGLEPTPEIAAARDHMVDEAVALLARWGLEDKESTNVL